MPEQYHSDRQLCEKVIALAKNAGERLPDNATVTDIEQCFRLQVCEEPLPLDKDGAFVEGEAKIIVNSNVTSVERRNFTFFHELTHHLVREDDDLYSYLHDAYVDPEAFDKTIEFLCNIGAAEMLLPRDQVRELIEHQGFSLKRVLELKW